MIIRYQLYSIIHGFYMN